MNLKIHSTEQYPISPNKSRVDDNLKALTVKLNEVENDLGFNGGDVILTRSDKTFLNVKNLFPHRTVVIFVEDDENFNVNWISQNYKIFLYLPSSFYQTHQNYSEFIDFFYRVDTFQSNVPIVLYPVIQDFKIAILTVKGFLVTQGNGLDMSFHNADDKITDILNSIRMFDFNMLRAMEGIISLFVINTLNKSSINVDPFSNIGKFIKNLIVEYLIKAGRETKMQKLMDITDRFVKIVSLPLMKIGNRQIKITI